MAQRGTKRKARKSYWPLLFFVAGVCAACAVLCPFVLPPEVGAALRKKGGASQTALAPDVRANVSWNGNLAHVTGRGRIAEDTAQGRVLARRAALTDARGNLLLLRERLLNDKLYEERRRSVSGTLRATKVRAERIEGSFYLLELDMALSDLLKPGYVEDIVF